MSLRTSLMFGGLFLAGCGSQSSSNDSPNLTDATDSVATEPVRCATSNPGPEPPSSQPEDGTAPDGTAPDGTAPDGTAPDGTAPDGTAPSPDVPLPQPEAAEQPGVEFIPWEQFVADGAPQQENTPYLSSPLDVRDVSPAWPYREEDLLIAYGTPSGNNTIVALSIDGRTARQHQPHFDCGDCRIWASWAGSVILTATTLYGSRDGGYRYFDIADADFVLPDQERELGWVRAVDDRIWVQTAAGWAGAPLDGTQGLTTPDWAQGRNITSVDRAGGLEVTARYVTLHTDEGDATSTDICHSGAGFDFGTAFHDGSYVVVPCDAEVVHVRDEFPDEAPTEVVLDSALQWAGRYAVASLQGWYGVSAELRGERLGSHAPLAEGEHVVGYLDSPDHGYRVTNFGVGVTTFASAKVEAETPPTSCAAQ